MDAYSIFPNKAFAAKLAASRLERKTDRKYAPSAAHRWLKCPGSETLKPTRVEQPMSVYALEGIVAHAVAEYALTHKSLPKLDYETELTREIVSAATEWKAYLKKIKGRRHIEELILWRVPGSKIVIEGTADAIINSGNTLHVLDLKFGAGLRVEAENNPQLLIYALGAYNGQETICLHIFQPRGLFDPGWRVWQIDAEALKWFGSLVAEIVKKKELNTGEHCRFCPAILECPAIQKQLEVVDSMKNMAKRLTTDEIKKVLDAAPQIKFFLKSVEDDARERMLSGEEIKGYKIVEAFGYREWTDEKETEKKLKKYGKAIFEPVKLKSPAQIEKITGRGMIDDLTTRPSRGPVLVPADDKRPELSGAEAAKRLGFETL
jgi:hypothetical protein